jgi:hypothetical protein
MSAVLEEKNVNDVKTQPTLSQRVGYVLVQMGDELEAQILNYQDQHIDKIDNVSSDLIADMDKRDITRLALLTGNDVQTVKQDIEFAIKVLAWMYFPALAKKPQWNTKPKVDVTELFGCMNTGTDGLEYERKMREEVW